MLRRALSTLLNAMASAIRGLGDRLAPPEAGPPSAPALPTADGPRAGPPADWVERVRRAAPHLLEPALRTRAAVRPNPAARIRPNEFAATDDAAGQRPARQGDNSPPIAAAARSIDAPIQTPQTPHAIELDEPLHAGSPPTRPAERPRATPPLKPAWMPTVVSNEARQRPYRDLTAAAAAEEFERTTARSPASPMMNLRTSPPPSSPQLARTSTAPETAGERNVVPPDDRGEAADGYLPAARSNSLSIRDDAVDRPLVANWPELPKADTRPPVEHGTRAANASPPSASEHPAVAPRITRTVSAWQERKPLHYAVPLRSAELAQSSEDLWPTLDAPWDLRRDAPTVGYADGRERERRARAEQEGVPWSA